LNFPRRICSSGFTVIELLAVVVIILILATIAFPSYQAVMSRIMKAKCVGNLRSLYTSFSSYVSDEGRWPQYHYKTDMLSQDYESWWINKMTPYGVTSETWLCPVLKALKLKGANGKPLRMHYVPTQFDANPQSPYRWPTQPWIVETGNAHGDGALIIFTNESVKSMNEVVPNNVNP
jgi:prepilin-type N-terminal cleavage/methylation domain-containing protein